MKEKKDHTGLPNKKSGNEEQNEKQGYPLYPANEDIYNKFLEEKNVDPEDITRKKEPTVEEDLDEKNKGAVKIGSDLDVPGSELDDELEDIGSEDEENNYYSLGGDDHTDLDEDNGV
jgi:hypothetical protein